MEKVLSCEEFLKQFYTECKNADWFPVLLKSCYSLDTKPRIINELKGSIHKGLRANFDEGVKYFWTIFLINPLIAIKAYEGATLLLEGGIDFNAVFHYISPIIHSASGTGSIYNPSEENFLIFAMEALLQESMNPEMLDTVNRYYLGRLYDHDKEIMSNKVKYKREGKTPPAKWLNHSNLRHILAAIDPRHIIILLEFFARKYQARLYNGNVRRQCYSGDKYDYIIGYIKKKERSLSEYIEWDNPNYIYLYQRYYEISLCYEEMFVNMDIIFPTREDKERIQEISGINISDKEYLDIRNVNKRKNPDHKVKGFIEKPELI